MKVNLNLAQSNNIKVKNKQQNQRYKSNYIQTYDNFKAQVSFTGFEARVQAKKPSGFFRGIGWWWSGEDKARAEVESEMLHEIDVLDEKIAVKEVRLNSLYSTLSGITSTHSSIVSSKKAQSSGLDTTKTHHKTTIPKLKETIQAKEDAINETQKTNKKFGDMLTEQKQQNQKSTEKNEDLRLTRQNNLKSYEENLKNELQKQLTTMQNLHEQEMNALATKINSSLHPVDSLKTAINISKKQGFSMIAGYEDQKSFLIDIFAKPVLLEQKGKASVVPNGILLYGPDNCGKSTFAKAFAGQLGCEFVEMPSSLDPKIDMQNLRKISSNAQKNFEKTGKRTIIFIKKLEEFAPTGSRITSALKGFMDNVSKDSHCTIFATTDSLESIHDILLRNSRFQKVAISPSDKQNTKAILKHYANPFVANSLNFDELSEQIIKVQPEQAFSNKQIKLIMQSLSQENIIQNIKNIGPDISNKAMTLFRKQLQLARNL